MMLRSERYRPLLHALAIATAATALLPIVVGALVTTRNAGMAFRDWPTSDGQGMLSYPWLQSAGDKFLEHGHRLAGIVIGCMSIALAAASWILEPRRWVRWSAVGVLLAVVLQGLLGGGRVLADERTLAMGHGAFAAAVFAFMASVALVQSRSWFHPSAITGERRTGFLKALASVTPLLIIIQYSLGGLVRHLGTALYEHFGMAFVAAAAVAATVVAAYRSRCGWFQRPAAALGFLLLCQLSLGGAAWVTRFGLPSVGYVAVQGSELQVLVRTSHTVVGMLLFMTAVVLLLRVLRVDWLRRAAELPVERFAAAVPLRDAVPEGRFKRSLS